MTKTDETPESNAAKEKAFSERRRAQMEKFPNLKPAPKNSTSIVRLAKLPRRLTYEVRKRRDVLFTDYEWDAVKKAAQGMGITAADYIRVLALYAAGLIKFSKAKIPNYAIREASDALEELDSRT